MDDADQELNFDKILSDEEEAQFKSLFFESTDQLSTEQQTEVDDLFAELTKEETAEIEKKVKEKIDEQERAEIAKEIEEDDERIKIAGPPGRISDDFWKEAVTWSSSLIFSQVATNDIHSPNQDHLCHLLKSMQLALINTELDKQKKDYDSSWLWNRERKARKIKALIILKNEVQTGRLATHVIKDDIRKNIRQFFDVEVGINISKLYKGLSKVELSFCKKGMKLDEPDKSIINDKVTHTEPGYCRRFTI